MQTCLLVHPGAELFGADRMLLESAIAVKQSGMDCIVACPEGGPLVTALESEGIRVVKIPMLVLRKALLRPRNWPTLLSGWVRGLVSAWKLISTTAPDCIYVSTITLPQWPLMSRLRRVPCITHVHEAEGSASRWVNGMLYLPHLASNAILVNSQFALQTIRRSLPRLAEGAEVVHNGVVGPPSPPSSPRVRLDGVLRILYLGRLSPRKGPDLIIDAAAALLNEGGTTVEVVLAGSTFQGYEWYEAELRSALQSAKLPENEVLVGFKESIWPLLEDCDVLVVPSRLDEPFGNTAVEGVLSHRPIIVSDTTGLREAASGYPSAQLIPRNNLDELVEALKRLIVNWDVARRAVGTSAAMARDRHDPALYRQRIIEAVARQVSPQPATKA